MSREKRGESGEEVVTPALWMRMEEAGMTDEEIIAWLENHNIAISWGDMYELLPEKVLRYVTGITDNDAILQSAKKKMGS